MSKQRFASPDERWVCHCCGRTSPPGGDRYQMSDTSCVTWAVLCYANKNADGSWQAVEVKS